MKLSDRGQKIEESLTLAISAKARELRADGHDVIGLGAGEPDFETPEHIGKAAKTAIDRGYTNYTPASGTRELKQAVQSKFSKDNGLNYDLNQIIISNGAKHCLFNTFQAILNQGDEVIIPQPCWVSYPEMVKMGGGIPAFVETTANNNFKVNIEDLDRAIDDNTKAFILNSPSNPAGCVYSRRELEEIASLAVEKEFWVVSDEIYEEIIYENNKHISIASLGEEIKNRTIVINGMSKAYAMTGWRIGFAAGPGEVINIMKNMQSHATSNPNSIAQYASKVGLEGSKKPVYEMVEAFKKRRDYLVDKIKEIPHIDCQKPGGAFYIMINIENLFGSCFQNQEIQSSMSFADLLLDTQKVAVVPGKAFGRDEFIRLSYAASMKEIRKGLKRLQKFIDELE